MARIAKEIPTATVATFSTMKYVNAPNFEKFRSLWNAKYLGGFIVHNQAFDGLTGKFPIGFLIWKTNQKVKTKKTSGQVSVEIIDKNTNEIGEKIFYSLPKNTYLNVWLKRPKKNDQAVIPLKNGLSPYVSIPRVKSWSDGAIAYMYCGGNDLQHTEQQTIIYSSVYGGGNGFYITPENLWQSAVIFAVRRLIKPTWINDRDQFLQPTEELSDEFKNDCLIWMLFNRCQRTASADGLEWDNRTWSIINHLIPYTDDKGNARERFDTEFMVEFLFDKSLSNEARADLDAGRGLWQAYFSEIDSYNIRDEYKLNRADVGWYQIRNALTKRNASGDHVEINFSTFEAAYKDLSNKLRPQVFELGFLIA